MSIIVALDTDNAGQAMALADQLDPALCRLKVGKELFTRTGPSVVHALHQRGFEIFLDLKFHDIPNTTAQAVLAAADMGVWMVNVHASGGRQMMETCVSRLQQGNYPTLLIGVTVLTSMDETDLADLGMQSVSPRENALRLAALARDSGLAGVVSSAQEAGAIRQLGGENFLRVTPGIRPATAGLDDQKRTCTPAEAMQNGATHLVIGRPVTRADDPVAALKSILASLPPFS